MAKISAFCGLIALLVLLSVANDHAGHNFYVTENLLSYGADIFNSSLKSPKGNFVYAE
jgi:hypothetical protein